MLWKKESRKKVHDILQVENQDIRKFYLLQMYIKDYTIFQI